MIQSNNTINQHFLTYELIVTLLSPNFFIQK